MMITRNIILCHCCFDHRGYCCFVVMLLSVFVSTAIVVTIVINFYWCYHCYYCYWCHHCFFYSTTVAMILLLLLRLFLLLLLLLLLPLLPLLLLLLLLLFLFLDMLSTHLIIKTWYEFIQTTWDCEQCTRSISRRELQLQRQQQMFLSRSPLLLHFDHARMALFLGVGFILPSGN